MDETLRLSVEADTSALDRSLGDLTAKANAFGTAMTGALKGAAFSGRSFEGVMRTLAQRISGIALDAALRPLGNLAGNLVTNALGGLGGALADGASPQRVVPFAKGGVVRAPTFFPMGRQTGLMGEAGAEAILPLRRGPGGELGVAAADGGARAAPAIVWPALVDALGGTVTLEAAPAPGALVTAGFEFDVPVRFDVDHLSVNLAAFEAGDIPSIPLVEVRP